MTFARCRSKFQWNDSLHRVCRFCIWLCSTSNTKMCQVDFFFFLSSWNVEHFPACYLWPWAERSSLFSYSVKSPFVVFSVSAQALKSLYVKSPFVVKLLFVAFRLLLRRSRDFWRIWLRNATSKSCEAPSTRLRVATSILTPSTKRGYVLGISLFHISSFTPRHCCKVR